MRGWIGSRTRLIWIGVALVMLSGALVVGFFGANPSDAVRRQQLLRYDEFREAALRKEWSRAETLYRELHVMPLPDELAQTLEYHGALAAYEQGEWLTAVARCEAAVKAQPMSPWRSSLYELWGLSLERLGNPEAAREAYLKANLPTTLRRARALAGERAR